MQGSAQKSNPLIGTNGPLGLKKVDHFRKYGALVCFPYATNGLSAFRQVGKTKGLLDC